ncbi:major Facilitator Superfamily protein [Mycobacterium xenopi 4042]|uniref:Major Facilitator Superfamily protein n=1 Tax=Mycobacterium xenopi 4042 TaxID=1299334 RepID=X8DZJ4_MYCXE|nr:major Facilitator Superfamily protein [Mycobacterium xenopi 4042]
MTNPWNALWATMVGFFMILVDATIVAVANPSIMAKLDSGYDTVIWVTSAYLLAYAVPLLVAGRLGDRFGRRISIWPVWRCSPRPPCGVAWRAVSAC